LASCEGKLRHLGVPTAPSRSTLSYANEHRPWELYQTVFGQLLEQCRYVAAQGKRKFRFKNKLMSIDGSVIDLCASMYDWAKFRRTKGAIKLHLLLDHDGYLPSFAVITPGKTHEIQVAREMKFAPGTIVVFDRGYTDYEWFAELTAKGVYFVTRMKDKADYGVVEKRAVLDKGAVRQDEVIFLHKLAAAGKECFLRRIEVWDEEKQETIVFLTNHLKFAASTIAAIYRDRWQVELFFESSTWCTPLDVMAFQEPAALNRPWAGALVDFVRPGIARRPLCIESTARLRRVASPATVFAESAAVQLLA
jgi:hypothetical protein